MCRKHGYDLPSYPTHRGLLKCTVSCNWSFSELWFLLALYRYVNFPSWMSSKLQPLSRRSPLSAQGQEFSNPSQPCFTKASLHYPQVWGVWLENCSQGSLIQAEILTLHSINCVTWTHVSFSFFWKKKMPWEYNPPQTVVVRAKWANAHKVERTPQLAHSKCSINAAIRAKTIWHSSTAHLFSMVHPNCLHFSNSSGPAYSYLSLKHPGILFLISISYHKNKKQKKPTTVIVLARIP